MFGRSGIDVDPQGTQSQAGGVSFVDSADRPAVRSFFERYGNSVCVLNGMEVKSITHTTCRRLLFTGTTASQVDDWPAILAGEAEGFTLPCLVLSGPSFTGEFPTVVIRAGETGQLSKLLDGSALQESEVPLQQVEPLLEELIAAHVAQRSEAFAAARTDPGSARFLRDLASAREQLGLVRNLGTLDLGSVDTSGYVDVSQRIDAALTCFSRGLTRCAVVKHEGLWGTGWDTHAGIGTQSAHFQVLFTDLISIQEKLEQMPGEVEATLAEEVVVVVFSEMGRMPQTNSQGGKDHWTETSAMLYGPGVSGGQVIGGFDDTLMGQRIDLATGGVDAGGTRLTSAHLGATILALGDVDPASYLGVDPIGAALG
jgi:hypothetical protein